MKPIEFCGQSLDAIRQFPAPVKRESGHQLDRVIYVAKFEDAVYVLHAFHKKTQ